jgi:hypothetical protein
LSLQLPFFDAGNVLSFRNPYPRLSARTFTEEYIPSDLAAVGLFRECEGS